MPLSGGGSGGYAARLSEYKNKGVVGLPERHDSTRVLEKKLLKLAQLVYASPKIAVLTGAGISTSAGIPDFRGPKGIWTLEDKEKKKAGKSRKRKHEETSTEGGGEEVTLEIESSSPPSDDPLPLPGDPFQAVPPTPTHMALAKLVSCNVLQCIITQNVDGVHLRSGVPRDKLCILHGDCFTEKCEKCGEEYFRDFDIGGVSFKYTGRSCEKVRRFTRRMEILPPLIPLSLSPGRLRWFASRHHLRLGGRASREGEEEPTMSEATI